MGHTLQFCTTNDLYSENGNKSLLLRALNETLLCGLGETWTYLFQNLQLDALRQELKYKLGFLLLTECILV